MMLFAQPSAQKNAQNCNPLLNLQWISSLKNYIVEFCFGLQGVKTSINFNKKIVRARYVSW